MRELPANVVLLLVLCYRIFMWRRCAFAFLYAILGAFVVALVIAISAKTFDFISYEICFGGQDMHCFGEIRTRIFSAGPFGP